MLQYPVVHHVKNFPLHKRQFTFIWKPASFNISPKFLTASCSSDKLEFNMKAVVVWSLNFWGFSSFFLIVTILMQVFYAVMASFNLSQQPYFPKGYVVHIVFYTSILFVSFFFVGKLDFAALGLKLASFWRSYLLVGLIFALLHLEVRSFKAFFSSKSPAKTIKVFLPT